MGFEVMGTSFRVGSNYKFCKALGKGAYGVVCSAENTKCLLESGKPAKVAIKKIKPMSKTVYDAKHTLREIRLLRYCGQHPNIVTLRDLVCNSMHDEVYIIMECMDTDLHRIIQSSQKLSGAHLKHFLFQLLRGLNFLHQNGILHRDLKPANLLVSKNCDLRISDFGLARKAADPVTDGQKYEPMTEHVVTRWYRPPELMLSPDGRYTAAVDMWSVGCICAELVGRTPLFPGKNFVHQLQLIFDVIGTPKQNEIAYIRNSQALEFLRNQPYKRPVHFRTVFPGCDPDVADFMMQCLRFTAMKRLTADEAMEHPYFDKAPYRNSSVQPIEIDVHNTFAFETEKLNEVKLRELILSEVKEFRITTTTTTTKPQEVIQRLSQEKDAVWKESKDNTLPNPASEIEEKMESRESRVEDQVSTQPSFEKKKYDKACKREKLFSKSNSNNSNQSTRSTPASPKRSNSRYTFDMASIMKNVRNNTNKSSEVKTSEETSLEDSPFEDNHDTTNGKAAHEQQTRLGIPQQEREQVLLVSSARGQRKSYQFSRYIRNAASATWNTKQGIMNSSKPKRDPPESSQTTKAVSETRAPSNNPPKVPKLPEGLEDKQARSMPPVPSRNPLVLSTDLVNARKGESQYSTRSGYNSTKNADRGNRGWSSSRAYTNHSENVSSTSNLRGSSARMQSTAANLRPKSAKKKVTVPKPFSFRIPERQKQWQTRRTERALELHKQTVKRSASARLPTRDYTGPVFHKSNSLRKGPRDSRAEESVPPARGTSLYHFQKSQRTKSQEGALHRKNKAAPSSPQHLRTKYGIPSGPSHLSSKHPADETHGSNGHLAGRTGSLEGQLVGSSYSSRTIQERERNGMLSQARRQEKGLARRSSREEKEFLQSSRYRMVPATATNTSSKFVVSYT